MVIADFAKIITAKMIRLMAGIPALGNLSMII
jgi:hypothetical protein